MKEAISLLNANSGAIQAIFASVVAIATIAYVFLTRRMWLEMRHTNERLNQPNIQVILEPGRKFGALFELVIKNLGNVPVYDLKLDVTPNDIRGFTADQLKDLNLFKVPISVFPERQEIRTILFDCRDISADDDKDMIVTFTASYKTIHGKEYIQKYDYNIKLYFGLSDLSEKNINDVVDKMDQMKNEITTVTKSIIDTNEKIEWISKIILNKLNSNNSKSKLVNSFLMSWNAFNLLGNQAFIGFNLYNMRCICLELYDKLSASCTSDNTIYLQICDLLVKMHQKRFYMDGGRSANEFIAHGDEVVSKIKQLSLDQPGSPWKEEIDET